MFFYGDDFKDISGVNRRRNELEGLINRYELFIGISPSKFGNRDIGEYLSFELSAQDDEVDPENTAVVEQVLEAIKKKRK